MFGRDKAIDPLAEAAKLQAASKARPAHASTEFAHHMLDKPAPPKRSAPKQDKPLTPEQLAAVEKLGEAHKAMAQQAAKGAVWIPRIIMTIVVLFVLRDMIPDVWSLLKSLIAAAP